jgi:hypothetical protein
MRPLGNARRVLAAARVSICDSVKLAKRGTLRKNALFSSCAIYASVQKYGGYRLALKSNRPSWIDGQSGQGVGFSPSI